MAGVVEDVLTFAHLVNPRLLADFTSPTLAERLPWVVLAIIVGVGGSIAVYIIVKVILAYCCLSKKYTSKLVWAGLDEKTNEHLYVEEHGNATRSYTHVVLETLFFFGIAIVLGVASSVAGFDLLHSSLMGIALSLIATYMFSIVITNMGTGYWVYLTDKIEEDQYWTLASMPHVHGLVMEMHPLFVQLRRRNDTQNGWLIIQVPMSMMVTGIWMRDTDLEGSMLQIMEDDKRQQKKEKQLIEPVGGQAWGLSRPRIRTNYKEV